MVNADILQYSNIVLSLCTEFIPSIADIYRTNRVHTLTLTLTLNLSLILNITVILSYLMNKHQYAQRDVSGY